MIYYYVSQLKDTTTLGCDYVWVEGLRCVRGHDIVPQSHVRRDYVGYPASAVPLEVAEDLRDRPFPCYDCETEDLARRWPRFDDPERIAFLQQKYQKANPFDEEITYRLILGMRRTLCNCPHCPSNGATVVSVSLLQQLPEIKNG